MNVGDDRHIAAVLPQAFHDMFEIARVFHGWRGDAHDFATCCRQLHCLLDRSLRVHRVARDHRLDADRICAPNPDVAHHHLPRDAALISKGIFAIPHNHGWVARAAQRSDTTNVRSTISTLSKWFGSPGSLRWSGPELYALPAWCAMRARLWRLRTVGARLRLKLVEPLSDERQILHVEKCDIQHVTDN